MIVWIFLAGLGGFITACLGAAAALGDERATRARNQRQLTSGGAATRNHRVASRQTWVIATGSYAAQTVLQKDKTPAALWTLHGA